jgi:predicted P-loop ATPase
MLKAPPTTVVLQWRETKGKGQPVASLYNVRIGLMDMNMNCKHNLFRDVTLLSYAGDVMREIKPIVGDLTDTALTVLRHRFDERFGFDPTDKLILDAVKTLAFQNEFDPILELLDQAQAEWDGTPRLDTWTIDYMKAEATELNCAIGRKVLIAAVRRARDPGCKFDNITTLEGEEGWNKSTAIRVLAGDEYFSDQSILGARDKEIQEQLAGIWMHESADLTGLKKADVDHVKAFASRQTDRARPAYGKVRVDKKRRSIDWATTNDDEWMQSQTGNRRFWPIAVGIIDIEALRRDRLQLLGEAAYYESTGETLVLDESLWLDAKAEQEKRRVKHPWEDILANMPDDVKRDIDLPDSMTSRYQIIHRSDDGLGHMIEQVASADLLTYVLRIPVGQQRRDHSMQLATTMKLLGWDRPDSQRVTIDGKQVRGYARRVDRRVPSGDDPNVVNTKF